MVVKESAGWKYTNTTSKNGEKSKELKEIVTGKYEAQNWKAEVGRPSLRSP